MMGFKCHRFHHNGLGMKYIIFKLLVTPYLVYMPIYALLTAFMVHWQLIKCRAYYSDWMHTAHYLREQPMSPSLYTTLIKYLGFILSSEELYKTSMFSNCWIEGVWCLTPLSTIFQLYRGGQFYWWGEIGVSGGENHRLTISHWQILSHNVVSSTSRLSGNQNNVSEWSDMFTRRLLFQWASTKRTSSSFHWKLTCSRHDIAENWWIGVKQQSLTHSLSLERDSISHTLVVIGTDYICNCWIDIRHVALLSFWYVISH